MIKGSYEIEEIEANRNANTKERGRHWSLYARNACNTFEILFPTAVCLLLILCGTYDIFWLVTFLQNSNYASWPPVEAVCAFKAVHTDNCKQ
jgi:hypothetical protein